MKTAVCLLLAQNNKFLSVSRRNSTQLWGLPGGKVDPDESNVEACLRETQEETGLISWTTDYTPIYSGYCAGAEDFWVTTYLWLSTPIDISKLVAEPGLTLSWKTCEQLVDPTISPFSEYNIKVFRNYSKWINNELAV